MRKIILAAALALSACATTNKVQLDTDKAIILGETSFIAMKQVALAGIQSGAISGATKNRVIDLVDQGQGYENAIVAGNNVAGNIAALSAVIAQLGQLGVKAR
jgi:hypothetical protein